MKNRKLLLGATIFLLALADNGFSQVPTIAEVPANLPDQTRSMLASRRRDLVKERDALKTDIKAHEARCKNVAENTPLDQSCSSEQASLETRKSAYISKVKQ